MKGTYKRKQFILPQETLDEVKKLLKAKTETEAVLLSLEEILKRKHIEDLILLPEKIHFDLTHKELKRQRAGD